MLGVGGPAPAARADWFYGSAGPRAGRPPAGAQAGPGRTCYSVTVTARGQPEGEVAYPASPAWPALSAATGPGP
jgi:hypothetical protein